MSTIATDYDVIVIGAGIAGLTAAKRLTQRGLNVASIEGGLFGGLVTNVNELEGAYAGSGADLASSLMMEIADLGCATLSETVTALAAQGDAIVVTTDAATHAARAVIVASGARLRRLGVPGEAALEYKGVSQCADCDGPLFQGERVVVVGAGDSALQEALVLSAYCADVRIVHRGAAPAARARWIDAVQQCANVTFVPEAEIEAIDGEDRVEAVRVRGARGTQRIPCAGVFAYVGLDPAADFMPAATPRDMSGALVVDASLATPLANVFAIGAVRSGYGGTLEDAVGDAHTAATAVLQRLR